MMPKKPRANRPSGTMPVAPLLPKRIGAGDVVTDLTRTMRAQAPEEQAQALIDQA